MNQKKKLVVRIVSIFALGLILISGSLMVYAHQLNESYYVSVTDSVSIDELKEQVIQAELEKFIQHLSEITHDSVSIDELKEQVIQVEHKKGTQHFSEHNYDCVCIEETSVLISEWVYFSEDNFESIEEMKRQAILTAQVEAMNEIASNISEDIDISVVSETFLLKELQESIVGSLMKPFSLLQLIFAQCVDSIL
ncbi:MAG: hypothetical protein FWE14_05450 [Lachnospiraceae bacterium]|nr:hypothetical protein [Lachnospiraceae bacterium]